MTRLEGRWLERPWGRERVWEAGDGAPVLAIHGLGGSGRYFERFAERVRGHRVVAPDLAGFGWSDKPDIAYERSDHLESLDAAVNGLDGPIVVVGHSLGGLFAALWAARDPGRVAALAILCAPFPAADGTQVWVREPMLPAAARVAGPALRTLARAIAVPVGIARGYPASVAADYARQTFRSRGRTMWSALYDPSVLDDLERIRGIDGAMPILVEHAEQDQTVRVDAHAKWTDLLPSAERRIVSGGHQVQLHEGFASLAGWIERAGG
ncbi:MAG TPA: alpha/beta hydrolase [Actinomycetota bacterium]